jgi:hypothetical protein
MAKSYSNTIRCCNTFNKKRLETQPFFNGDFGFGAQKRASALLIQSQSSYRSRWVFIARIPSGMIKNKLSANR